MTAFDESQHPRATSGQFAEKVNSAPSGTLAAPGTRLIAEHRGDFFPAPEIADRGLTERDVELYEDELIDVPGPDDEPADLEDVRQWLSDGGSPVSEVTIRRDYDDESKAVVDISTYENLEHLGFTEDELDEHFDTIKSVYEEWFNAELDVCDTWESVRVEIRAELPAEGATPLLVLEKASNAHAKYLNETDRGTYGSPYVGTEIRRRIDAEKEKAA